jgi:superfamily II RNA helicase
MRSDNVSQAAAQAAPPPLHNILWTKNVEESGVVFASSSLGLGTCRECESYGSYVQRAELDFNTEEEKEQVQMVFDNAMQCLSESDRQLDAIANIVPMLRAGIGVHHSGLLPIIKELTELLFQEHLIKVLP